MTTLLLCLLSAAAGAALLHHFQRRVTAPPPALHLESLPPASAQDAPPTQYHPMERQALERYITDAFGPIAQLFYEPESRDIQLDIAVIAPTDDEDCYKLVTIGMGARAMSVPTELAEHNCAFAELCIYLPPDWRLLSSDPEDTWPFHWLKAIAHLPVTQENWLGAGHCVNTGTLEAESPLTQLLLAWAAVDEESTPRLLLPGGKLINFYQLVPLYDQEVTYRNQRGFGRLWQRMMIREISPVVDMTRESCYDPEAEFPYELLPFMWTQREKECTFSLYVGEFLQEQFEAAGLAGNGYEWEALAQTFLHRQFPKLIPYIHFDSDCDLFFAYSTVEAVLRLFSLGFRDLCGDEEAFCELLTRISGSEA